ncbi:MAG: hypothetical protein PHW69_01430 [Elusimicrobiaceae bacterium]|nr:hypothetical protein [Elusimicrobiaceae bacterium]
MNYWLYARGEITGPFDADELVSRDDFRLTSLVCPEDRLGESGADWVCASEFGELKAALSGQDEPGTQENADGAGPTGEFTGLNTDSQAGPGGQEVVSGAEADITAAAGSGDGGDMKAAAAGSSGEAGAEESGSGGGFENELEQVYAEAVAPAADPEADGQASREILPDGSEPDGVPEADGGTDDGPGATAEAERAEGVEGESPDMSSDPDTIEMLRTLGYSEQEARQLIKFDGAVLEPEDGTGQQYSGAKTAREAAGQDSGCREKMPRGVLPADRSGADGGLAGPEKKFPRALGEVAPGWVATLKENEILQELAQDSTRFSFDSSEPDEEEETAADYMRAQTRERPQKSHARRPVYRRPEYSAGPDDEFEDEAEPQSGFSRRHITRAAQPAVSSDSSRQESEDDDTSISDMEFPQQMVSPSLLDTELYRADEPEKERAGQAGARPESDSASSASSDDNLPPARNMDLSALARDTISRDMEDGSSAVSGDMPPVVMREDLVTSPNLSPSPQPTVPPQFTAPPPRPTVPPQFTAPPPRPTVPPQSPQAVQSEDSASIADSAGPAAKADRDSQESGPFMGDIQARIAALSRTERLNATGEPKVFPAMTEETAGQNKTQMIPDVLPGNLFTEAFTKTSMQSGQMTASAALPAQEQSSIRMTRTHFSGVTGGVGIGTQNDLRTVHVAAEVRNARLTAPNVTQPGGAAPGAKKMLVVVLAGGLAAVVLLAAVFLLRGRGKAAAEQDPAATATQPDAGGTQVSTSAVPAAATAAQPSGEPPGLDAAAKSELAVSIVKQHSLPGGKGTIENWFANTLVAGLGGEPYEEKWESKSCYRSTCYVYYKLLQPRKEPLQYGFVVDTDARKIKSGINNKAVELLGGDDGMFSSPSGKANKLSPSASEPDYSNAARSASGKPAVKTRPAVKKKKKAASVPDQLPLPKDPHAGRSRARALIDEISADERSHYDSLMDDEYKKRKTSRDE